MTAMLKMMWTFWFAPFVMPFSCKTMSIPKNMIAKIQIQSSFIFPAFSFSCRIQPERLLYYFYQLVSKSTYHKQCNAKTASFVCCTRFILMVISQNQRRQNQHSRWCKKENRILRRMKSEKAVTFQPKSPIQQSAYDIDTLKCIEFRSFILLFLCKCFVLFHLFSLPLFCKHPSCTSNISYLCSKVNDIMFNIVFTF